MRQRFPYTLIGYLTFGGIMIGMSFCQHAACGQEKASADATFEDWDSDDDGRVSRDELPARLRRNFDRVDRNSDGAISLQEHRQFLQRRDRSKPTVPDDVKILRDLSYVADGHERQKLDLYLPKTDAPTPLIIWVHGGAWRAGNKDPCPVLGFLDEGYAIASVNYRLSQHEQFPAQIEDCLTAIRWLRERADEYNLDGDRFVVWGASAGGHLAALVGASGGETKFNAEASISSPRVAAVIDFFGPTDFSKMNQQGGNLGVMNHDAADSPESRLIGGPVQERPDQVRAANPATYVDRKDPPVLIVHGDKDPLVPLGQSQLLAQTINERGGKVELIVVKGGGHGPFHNDRYHRRVKEFLDQHLSSPE